MKRMIEIAIFGFILFQIASLTSFTNKDDGKIAKSVQSATLASVQAFVAEENLRATEYVPSDFDDAVAHAEVSSAVKAQKEAQRIVAQGDIESYINKVKNNKTASFLLGLE